MRWLLAVLAAILTLALLRHPLDARPPRDAPAVADTTTPASAWLALLPDGETKRRFVLDCAGCHVFDGRTATLGGRSRTHQDWSAAVSTMLLFAGSETSFPIMSPEREAEATAAWLTASLGDRVPAPHPAPAVPEGWEVRVYSLPRPDLPHDVAVAADGRIVVTGMMTGVMYLLDPESGSFETIEIPVPQANPRAVEVAPDGAWWVVLGGPGMLARRDAASGEWSTWSVGVYAHEAAIDSSGRVWFNGHFTKSPETLGALDPATGEIRRWEVPSPPMPEGGSTIPYGLRAAADGTIWMTQLLGNRLVRLDPASGAFTLYDFPSPHSGPRRLDVARDGTVWVPEFSGGRLARLVPGSAELEEIALPDPDVLPYVARSDPRSGAVWMGTGAGDRVLRVDPATGAVLEFPLPGPSALVRHLAVDPGTGDVWGATGPFPVVAPRVFVIRRTR